MRSHFFSTSANSLTLFAKGPISLDPVLVPPNPEEKIERFTRQIALLGYLVGSAVTLANSPGRGFGVIIGTTCAAAVGSYFGEKTGINSTFSTIGGVVLGNVLLCKSLKVSPFISYFTAGISGAAYCLFSLHGIFIS